MKLKKFAPQKNAAQAIVEFAIVLPILLLLLYGLLEAGRLLFVYSSIVTASRQAARYGSATGLGADFSANGGPSNTGVFRYQDCAGIKWSAQRADYLNVFDDDDIIVTYDNGPGTEGPDPWTTTPTVPPWRDICNGDTDNAVDPASNNTTRINVTVRGHFTSIVPKIVPFFNRTIIATSARTILVAVSIQVGAAAGPANANFTAADSSAPVPPAPAGPGVTQPGEDFTLTATLNGTAGPAAGTLVFSFEGTILCTETLVNGSAACSMNLPHTGDITVAYTPDDPSIYNAQEFTVLHTVGPAETQITVVDTPDQTLPGGEVIISVLVTNRYGGSVPTGTVAISTVAGNCSITLVNGVGSCPTPLVFNDLGTYNIDAVYTPGDFDHKASNGFTTHDVVPVIQPPTNTPPPPTAIPTTPAPPTVTPVPGCDTINTKTGQIALSGKTMSLTLNNTGNNYPVTVSSVFVAWNYSAGHQTGNTSLWLQKADANGTIFWTSPSPSGINQPSALLPLSTAVTVPANGNLKITFTFDKIYDRPSNEQVQVQFSTRGCENYPVVRPAGMPTITPVTDANLKVQLTGGGTDNANETQFWFRVQNSGTGPGTNISVRIYFQTDPSLSATDYALDELADDSPGSAGTITGPTLLSGKVYYYTISFGSASLQVGSTWTFQARLRATNGKYDSTNDWWHTSGALPGGGTWTDWTTIPVYVGTNRVWGTEPP